VASCPDDKVVIGGGALVQEGGRRQVRLTQSRPLPEPALEDPEPATTTCPGGYRTHGIGGGGGITDSGPSWLNRLYPHADLRGVTTTMTGPLHPSIGAMVTHQICARTGLPRRPPHARRPPAAGSQVTDDSVGASDVRFDPRTPPPGRIASDVISQLKWLTGMSPVNLEPDDEHGDTIEDDLPGADDDSAWFVIEEVGGADAHDVD
jgi:hypothetical protein